MTGMPAFLQWRASIPFRVELYTLVVPAKMGSSSGRFLSRLENCMTVCQSI